MEKISKYIGGQLAAHLLSQHSWQSVANLLSQQPWQSVANLLSQQQWQSVAHLFSQKNTQFFKCWGLLSLKLFNNI